MKNQPWIGKPSADISFILLPPFVSLAIIALLPSLFNNNDQLQDFGWIILVLMIDVAHVYSTLFKTYFNPKEFSKRRTLFIVVPVTAFVVSVLIYSISGTLFWRLLAYMAVFHFVRQQYGFMRLYSRNEKRTPLTSIIDQLAIYSATLYPIVYWHFSGPKNFNWFLENDFIYLKSQFVIDVSLVAYLVILSSYFIKELIVVLKERYVNIPKLMIVAGTVLSWYFGIVYFNGDIAFTLLNVVSHGIPYMALIYITGKKTVVNEDIQDQKSFLFKVFSRYGIVLFLGTIFLFAFVEEALWDISVWKERANIFGSSIFTGINLNKQLLSLVVPLLALPQLTHYILDGFIWKRKNSR